MGRPSKNNNAQAQEVESTAPVIAEVEGKEETEATTETTIQEIEISMGEDNSFYKNTGDVKFEYKDGRVSIISNESAEIFTKRGLGKIVKWEI